MPQQYRFNWNNKTIFWIEKLPPYHQQSPTILSSIVQISDGKGRLPLKRSKSYDSYNFSNIIVNEINNRKNTNLHFIGYSEWLRCSSYNELASLKGEKLYKVDIFRPNALKKIYIGKRYKNNKNAGYINKRIGYIVCILHWRCDAI